MANQQHMEQLKRGVAAWNNWRKESRVAAPDLSGADLRAIATNLSGINFRKANLERSILAGINFSDADLYDAQLKDATINDASVKGAILSGADFSGAVVDGIKYDKRMKCWGTRVDACVGNQRFKRAVIESDYIEAFRFEHPTRALFWSLTSDYSRSPMRIGLIGAFIILLFASIFHLWPQLIHWPSMDSTPSQPSWVTSIYYSVVTFTTLGYGDIYPSTTTGRMLAICEVVIGYVWLGYLVSVLASRSLARA